LLKVVFSLYFAFGKMISQIAPFILSFVNRQALILQNLLLQPIFYGNISLSASWWG